MVSTLEITYTVKMIINMIPVDGNSSYDLPTLTADQEMIPGLRIMLAQREHDSIISFNIIPSIGFVELWVGMTKVILFKMEDSDIVLLGVPEFLENRKIIEMKLYQFASKENIYQDSLEFCTGIENIFGLDIDGTIALVEPDFKSHFSYLSIRQSGAEASLRHMSSFLSEEEKEKLEQNIVFKKNGDIMGSMSYGWDNFNYPVMFRSGLYETLRRLNELGPIVFITAGYISYAREIVKLGNQLNWMAPQGSPQITVHPEYIISVRSSIAGFVLKSSKLVIQDEIKDQLGIKFHGLDDRLDVWDMDTRASVMQIPYFNPADNKESYLLDRVELIEKSIKK
jgi:hypothetical protein